MITCWISLERRPDRSMAALIATPPSSTAVFGARAPPSRPNGVRAPAKITLRVISRLLTRPPPVRMGRPFTHERPGRTALAVDGGLSHRERSSPPQPALQIHSQPPAV